MNQLLLNQHILILGLGASGLSMARWCARLGAMVTVLDTRDNPPQLETLQETLPNVRFQAGDFTADKVSGTDIRAVFKSPGLSPSTTAALIDAAKASGLWVGNELSLFNHALRELAVSHHYRPRVLGVTGTNGKTTVTTLTGLLVARAGLVVAVAGNIGPPLLTTLGEYLDSYAQSQQSLPEVWVLELSSFQLDGVTDFAPTAATVLNLSEDHLDWHGDMKSYAAAKENIYGFANGQSLKAQTQIRFSPSLPTAVDEFGIEVVAGMKWLVRAAPHFDEPTPKVKKGAPAAAVPFSLQRLMPADALRIRGLHNATNALAALALAYKAGCPLAPMLYGLRDYAGEAHRMETIAVHDDVTFIDDSKGTNVGATVAALNSLGQELNGKKIVLILGGDGKGQDFKPLAPLVEQFVHVVLLIGRDALQIKAALASTSVEVEEADSLEAAVHRAYQHARLAGPSSVVLLSPACASLDMFRDYQHRAEVFKATVQAIAMGEELTA